MISDLANSLPEMIVGAGTVLDVEMAQRCVDAGAKFLTSAGLVPEVVEFATNAFMNWRDDSSLESRKLAAEWRSRAKNSRQRTVLWRCAFLLCTTSCYAFAVAKDSAETRKVANAGLCADCAHVRWIKSDRGSTFVLCELSARDPNFSKYPRLPVLSCSGHERKPSSGD